MLQKKYSCKFSQKLIFKKKKNLSRIRKSGKISNYNEESLKKIIYKGLSSKINVSQTHELLSLYPLFL